MQLERALSPLFVDLIQTIDDYMSSAVIMVDQATNTSQAGLFRQAPQKAIVDASTQTLPKEADVNTQITSRPGQF